MTYKIVVEFQRELDDDADVIGKPIPKITDKDVIEQFRKELQHAYDSEDSGLAGRFQIKSVKW